MGKIASFLIASPENNFRPPVLSYKAFLIYGILLLLLRLFLGALSAESAAVESQTLMSLINEERENRNLTRLFTHRALLTAASEKSQDMIDRDYFAHVDPDGNYVWPKIVAAGYTPYKILGENLAVDFATSEGLVKAWIDSPTHRANLLHPDFFDQGLAALFGDYQGRYTNLTTSLFGAPTEAAKPKPKVKAEAPALPPPAPGVPPPLSVPEAISTPTTTAASGEEAKSPPLVVKKAPRAPEPFVAPEPSPPARSTVFDFLGSARNLSRTVFTLFGVFLLLVLSADSVIISRHEAVIERSHSSYHLFTFILIVLLSILIWWW